MKHRPRPVTPLERRLHDTAYAGLDLPIRPYLGDGYEAGADDTLRVMTLGLNSYYSEGADSPHPEWFTAWVKEAKHRYFRGMRAETRRLASALAPSPYFAGRTYRGLADLYATNAVKTLLPASEGKSEALVKARHWKEGRRRFAQELGVLGDHHRLPHLLIVFGRGFWAHVVSTFEAGRLGPYRVADHVWSPGRCLHHVNRYRLQSPAHAQTLILVRLRHPAAWSGPGTADWLEAQNDFRQIVGLSPLDEPGA